MSWDPSLPAMVGKPNLAPTEDFSARVEAIMRSGWLTNQGPQARALEAALAERIGVRHVVLVANATLGLQLALRAVVEPGEIIMPSFTFAATAQAARWCGYIPRFVDIDPVRQELDLRQVEAAVTDATRAILPVHMWGRPCPVDEIDRIAARHRLKVVYDAAHAFGSTLDGREVGTFGDAEVFSFHATKFFNTFEGGAVATNDDAVAEACRAMRSFGMEAGTISEVGTNAKMSEIHAAHGLCLLERIPEIVRANRQVLDAIEGALAPVEGLRVVPTRDRGTTNAQYAVVRLDDGSGHRDALIAALAAEGIGCRPYFSPPCHLHGDPVDAPSLPHTEAASATTLAIPCGPQLGPERARAMCAVIATHHARLRGAQEPGGTREVRVGRPSRRRRTSPSRTAA